MITIYILSLAITLSGFTLALQQCNEIGEEVDLGLLAILGMVSLTPIMNTFAAAYIVYESITGPKL